MCSGYSRLKEYEGKILLLQSHNYSQTRLSDVMVYPIPGHDNIQVKCRLKGFILQLSDKALSLFYIWFCQLGIICNHRYPFPSVHHYCQGIIKPDMFKILCPFNQWLLIKDIIFDITI